MGENVGVRLGILGPIEVTNDDGIAVPLGPPKQRALLTALAVRPNRVVRTERLVDTLWNEQPPASAVNLVQGYASKLRRLLGDQRLMHRDGGYVLVVASDELDAAQFEHMASEGRLTLLDDPAAAAQTFSDALELWRGTPFAELPDASDARAEGARLEEQYLGILEESFEAGLAAGRHSALTGDLEAAVQLHPLRERLRALQMAALYRSGRQADALAAYQDARRVLAEELGLDPGPELRALEQAILRHDPSLTTREHRPLGSTERSSPVPNNLPVPTTTLIGRERDTTEVEVQLLLARVVTLIGPGGCGKTRLALETAQRVLDAFPAGVWWVDLAKLANPELVGSVMANALSVQEVPNQPIVDTLGKVLRDERCLIVIDNCEHLIEVCADIVEGLLRTTRHTTFLATSREPIGVDGEVVYRTPTLSFPAATAIDTVDALAHYDGVRLFADRARHVHAGFVLTEQNAPAVADICRRLEGMPLALELVAARLRILTAEDIAVGLGDMFQMVVGGARTALPRQRTLEASIDWSHGLLGDAERVLLRRLAVFAGGFTLTAAEAVCGGDRIAPSAVLDLLGNLVDKSLVQMDGTASATRYRLLEPIRVYAEAKLDAAAETAEVCERHLALFVSFAEGLQSGIEGRDHDRWTLVIQTELANIRAALDWASDIEDGDSALRLAGALWNFWVMHNVYEGRAQLKATLQLPVVDQGCRPLALAASYDLAMTFGDPASASAFGDEAVAICRELRDSPTLGRATLAAGWPKVFLDRPRARPLLEESIAVSRRAGDDWVTADGLAGMGFLELCEGFPTRARIPADEAVVTAQESGNIIVGARAAFVSGWVLQLLLELPIARARFQQMRERTDSIPERMWGNLARVGFALIDLLEGEIDGARQQLQEAMREAEDILSGFGIAIGSWAAAQAAHAAGDADAAIAAIERGLPMQERTGLHWLAAWNLATSAEIAVAAGDSASARSYLERGQAFARTYPNPIAVGRLQHARAAVAVAAGDLVHAATTERQVLHLFGEAGHRQGAVDALERFGTVLCDLEHFPASARLTAAAKRLRDDTGYVWFPAAADEDARVAARCRAALGPDGFGTARQEGLALSLTDAIACADEI